MMRSKNLLLLVLAGISPAAFAYDTEYVIMGGFSTVVNAFTRIKLIFNDNQYSMLIAAFVFMGLASAILFRSAKQGIEFLETGKAQLGMGWMAMTIIGTLIYFGLVQPKGTVHIYDQTRNEYQSVSGIPDFLTVTAGLTNTVYQAFVDMSNRDTASTTRFTGEGTAIKMLMNLLSRNGSPFDAYLTDSVKMMWKQCEPIAEARGFDPRAIKSGANALDVVNSLSQLRNQAAYTVWYSSSAPGGTSITCDEAYTTLKGELGNPSAYDNRLKDVCTKSGYNVSGTAQYVDCKGRIESGLQTIFGSSSLSINGIMSNILVSQAITDALIEDNPELASTMLANRSMMNSGIADSMTNPEWISTIMAAVLAIILVVTPMLLLLVFTPLMAKALTLLFGLWVFITTWQIADVVLLQASTDEILTVMSEIKLLGLGIDSMQLAPSAAMKAMSVLGSARTSAVQIATLVAGIFGVSAFGIGAFGQRAISKLDRTSDEVSDKALTTEGRGHLINDNRAGLSAQGELSTVGIDKMAGSSMYGELSNVYSSQAQIQGLGGGNINQAALRSGEVQGGQQIGHTRGFDNALPGMSGGQAASFTSQVGAEHEAGNAVGRIESAGATGMNVAEQARLTGSTSSTMQTADAQSNLDNAGGQLSSLHKQQKLLHGTERQTEIGTSEGTLQAANAAGISVTDLSRERTSVTSSADYGRSLGTLEAAGGNLSSVQNREKQVSSVNSAENIGHAGAMRNAFGSNSGIESGVAAMQSEQTKQHAVDMQRQGELVQRIQGQDSDGRPQMNEEDARRSLSDANGAQVAGQLIAHGMDGKSVEDTSAYDSTRHLAQNTGEQQAIKNNNMDTVSYFTRGGQIATEHGVASQKQFDELSDTIGGDQKLAAAETGAGVHLAVNKEQAQNLSNAGLINEQQVQSLRNGDVGRVDISMGRNEDGMLAATGGVQTGKHASIDNSYKKDSSYHMDKGIDTGGDNSSRALLSDPREVFELIKASNSSKPGSAADVLANEASRSLNSIRSAHNETNSTTSVQGGIEGSLSGGRGMGIPAGLSAGASGSISDSDNETTNAMYGAMKSQVEKMQAAGMREAGDIGLSGDAKQNYVDDYTARNFSSYYADTLRRANAETMTAGLETKQQSFSDTWNKVHSINDRATSPDIPTTANGNTQLISAQEYMWKQSQQPAIETASEKLTREVAAEKSPSPGYSQPTVQTVYRSRKAEENSEGDAKHATVPEDTGAHPPVKAGNSSNSIPVATSANGNSGKAPK